MRSVTQDRYGDSSVLRIDERPVPEPKKDEVIVEVRAAGLDRGAWHLMAGKPYLIRPAFGLRRPRTTIGIDLAGVVTAVGSDVDRFAAGDEVYGAGVGAYASFARAKADKLLPKPDALSFPEAAIVPVSGITAHQAVHRHGAVGPDERVLVIGASGGVGSYAVQCAVAAGATVTAMTRGDKADHAIRLGATDVIDYTTTELDDVATSFDLIIDIGGNRPVRTMRRRLVDRGRLVIVGGEHAGSVTGGLGRSMRAAALSPFTAHTLKMFVAGETAEELQPVDDLLRQGSIIAPLDRTFALDDIRNAMDYLLSGQVEGKVALIP